MNIYTYSEARQNLATLLDQALQEGEVLIRRKDGRMFTLKPRDENNSPLDVAGVDLGITGEEIMTFIHEGRRY